MRADRPTQKRARVTVDARSRRRATRRQAQRKSTRWAVVRTSLPREADDSSSVAHAGGRRVAWTRSKDGRLHAFPHSTGFAEGQEQSGQSKAIEFRRRLGSFKACMYYVVYSSSAMAQSAFLLDAVVAVWPWLALYLAESES